jgi:hypothetical protein
MLRWLTLIGCLLSSGCAMLPDIVHQPTLHNPFPQISKVAVVPFFNASTEPTLDCRKVAEGYASELAEVPGYVVVPVPQADTLARSLGLRMDKEKDCQRLAQVLQVDAVVIGIVTEYQGFPPFRLTMQVQWFAANPNFHPIPAGYGLPWGRPGEKDIPGPLVFQAELALAKEQLKTQTPPYQKALPDSPTADASSGTNSPGSASDGSGKSQDKNATKSKHDTRTVSHEEAVSPAPSNSSSNSPSSTISASATTSTTAASAKPATATVPPGEDAPGLPPNWPDPHGFIPRPPTARPATGVPSDEPIMQHVKTFRANDEAFTTALEDYYYSRDDARMGGWQAYLYRSDDFIRFCCRLHIWEMLSARGGAGETRVVWRWSSNR